jgi:carbonic anhydrase
MDDLQRRAVEREQRINLPVAEKIEMFLANRNIDFSSLAKGQTPVEIAMTCSDSRVPKPCELNRIFWITNAGGILGTEAQATIQYALGFGTVKRLTYFAHTRCGMLKAAISDEGFQGPLGKVVGKLRGEYEVADIEYATKAHLKNSVGILGELRKAAGRGDVEIFGYLYHTESGKIELIMRL